jgi:cell wall assembly regulator SMI1
VRYEKWLAEEDDSPVLVLNVIPLFPEEADVVHRIGDAEAYRQFRQAGVNWYAPSRPRVDLRLPESADQFPEKEKTAMTAADERAPDPAPEAVWDEIEAWLGEHAPAVQGRLPAGASAESLDRLEKEIGVPLPPAYRSLLQRHDGGVPWRSYDLLSADEVLSGWKSNNEMQEQDPSKDAEVETAGGRIAETWWNRGWIPIARDSGGNQIAIDMAPGPAGQAGQIIRWDTLEGPSVTEHASFQALLQQLRDDLAAGKYTATEDETLEFDWS